MPSSTAISSYRAFLAGRWPDRTRGLALHAFAGTFALALLDWIFARALGLPVGPATNVWPTSPMCVTSRNGVAPSVRVTISGGPSR